jgi:hypothetical protein
MPEEENPFLIKPKKAHETEEKTEAFGSEEMVSFMVTPEESKKKEEIPVTTEKPHWESSGTPIWDRKTENIDEEDYEVVDHN